MKIIYWSLTNTVPKTSLVSYSAILIFPYFTVNSYTLSEHSPSPLLSLNFIQLPSPIPCTNLPCSCQHVRCLVCETNCPFITRQGNPSLVIHRSSCFFTKCTISTLPSSCLHCILLLSFHLIGRIFFLMPFEHY